MARAGIHRHLDKLCASSSIQEGATVQGTSSQDSALQGSTEVAVARLELSAGRTMAGRNRGSGGGEVRKWVVIVG